MKNFKRLLLYLTLLLLFILAILLITNNLSPEIPNTSSVSSFIDLENFNLTSVPELITIPIKPTLNDGWLSGFTDAEGCFSITVKKKRKNHYSPLALEARFILDQKCRSDSDIAILYQISTLFINIKDTEVNKSVKLRSKTDNVYRITVQCNDIKKLNSTLIINYFTRFRLITSKHNSFLI